MNYPSHIAVDGRFRALVETTPDTIIIVNAANQIIFCNEKVKETFGYEPEELLNRNFDLLIPELVHLQDPESDSNRQNGPVLKMGQTVEITGQRKDGSTLPIELSISCWSEDSEVFFSSIIRDISERQRIQQQLELLLTLTEAVVQASDFEEAITIAVKRVCELTRWDYGEAWIPSADGQSIRYSNGWYTRHSQLEDFAEASKLLAITPGNSLVGRIFQNCIEWIPELEKASPERFIRIEEAREAGLKSALGVPIAAGNKVMAAMVFFMSGNKTVDERLTKIVSSAALQLGTVLHRKKAEEELRESEARFRMLFENSTDAILLIDGETVIDCNHSTVTMLAAESKDQVLATNPIDLFPETQPDGMSSLKKAALMMRRVLATGSQKFEWMQRKLNGENFWVEVSLTSLYLGERPVFHLVMRDINARKLVEHNFEKERQYLNAILENVEDGIVACDEHGQLAFFNRATREFHGLDARRLRPDQWPEYYALYRADGSTPLRQDEIPLVRAYNGDVVTNEEMVIAPRNGKRRLLLASGRRIISKTGELLGAVVVMHDITGLRESEVKLKAKNRLIVQAYTELKKAEQELMRSNAELEERVRERTEELSSKNEQLNEKNGELLKINTDLDNFIYITSHDLKGPLLNAQALVNIMREDAVMPNPEDAEVLNKLEHSIVRMKQTIQEITDIARVQRSPAEQAEYIDLENLTREIMESIAEMIIGAAATIETDFKAVPGVHFPVISLRSILYNLLTNAIKYRSPNQQTYIKLSTEREGNFIVLIVKDNGIGMDMDLARTKLFGMFERLHSHVEGSGVGLYVVKRIIENNGGSIEVESEVGKGTIFRVYFKAGPEK